MSASAQTVVGTVGVIVSPKRKEIQVKFRWDPDLAAEIKAIADKTNRSMNEAGELLMRWAVERAKQELEMGGAPTPRRKTKEQ